MKVYVDTNGWLRCAAWRIDIWAEAKRLVPGTAEVLVIDRVMHELEGLKAGGGMLAREAKLALEIIRLKKPTIIATIGAKRADDALVETAKEPDFVLTQDKILKQRLRKKHVNILVIRGETHLDIENV